MTVVLLIRRARFGLVFVLTLSAFEASPCKAEETAARDPVALARRIVDGDVSSERQLDSVLVPGHMDASQRSGAVKATRVLVGGVVSAPVERRALILRALDLICAWACDSDRGTTTCRAVARRVRSVDVALISILRSGASDAALPAANVLFYVMPTVRRREIIELAFDRGLREWALGHAVEVPKSPCSRKLGEKILLATARDPRLRSRVPLLHLGLDPSPRVAALLRAPDTPLSLRSTVLLALSKSSSVDVAPLVSEFLVSDESDLKAFSAQSLASAPHHAARIPVALLARALNVSTPTSFDWLLGVLVHRTNDWKQLSRPFVRRLEKLLRHPDDWRSEVAARAIRFLRQRHAAGDVEVGLSRETLVSLSDSAHRLVRIECARLLLISRAASPKFERQLANIVRNSDQSEDERSEAASKLSHGRLVETLSVLAAAARSTSRWLCVCAVRSLQERSSRHPRASAEVRRLRSELGSRFPHKVELAMTPE